MLYSLIIATTFANAGCVATEVKETVTRNTLRLDKQVLLMDNNKTTWEQDKNFIRAIRASFHAMNFYLNGAPLPLDLKWMAE